MAPFPKLMCIDILEFPSLSRVRSFHTLYARCHLPGVRSTVGPRYGCLHPLTSLKLYYAYCYSILGFGLDVLWLTKSELLMLERSQLAILRAILGFPSRSNFLAIRY